MIEGCPLLATRWVAIMVGSFLKATVQTTALNDICNSARREEVAKHSPSLFMTVVVTVYLKACGMQLSLVLRNN